MFVLESVNDEITSVCLLTFIATVGGTIAIIFKCQKKIFLKIAIFYSLIMLVFIIIFIILTTPLSGYTKEFKEKGNPLRNQDLIIYQGYDKNNLERDEYNQLTSSRNVEGCLKQNDIDTEAKYLNRYNSIDLYSYEASGDCEMVNFSKLKIDYIALGNIKNIPLGLFDKKESVNIYLNNKEDENISFNDIQIKKLNISFNSENRKYSETKPSFDDTTYNFNMDLNGIENVDVISIEILFESDFMHFTYDITNGELDEFLEHWGYLAKDGYKGKKYPKPSEASINKKMIKLEEMAKKEAEKERLAEIQEKKNKIKETIGNDIIVKFQKPKEENYEYFDISEKEEVEITTIEGGDLDQKIKKLKELKSKYDKNPNEENKDNYNSFYSAFWTKLTRGFSDLERQNDENIYILKDGKTDSIYYKDMFEYGFYESIDYFDFIYDEKEKI